MSTSEGTGVRYKWCRFTTSTTLDAFTRMAGLSRNSITISKKKNGKKSLCNAATSDLELDVNDTSGPHVGQPKNFYTAIVFSSRPESPEEPSSMLLDSATGASSPASPIGTEVSETTSRPSSFESLSRGASPTPPGSSSASSSRASSPSALSGISSFVPTTSDSSPEDSSGIASSVSDATLSCGSRPESPSISSEEDDSMVSSRSASPAMSLDSNASTWSAVSSISRPESPPPTLSAIAAASLWSAAIAVPLWNPAPAISGNGYRPQGFQAVWNNAPQSSNWSAASHLLHWSATAPDYSWNATPPWSLLNSTVPSFVWGATSPPTLWHCDSPASLLNGLSHSSLWSGSSPASLWSSAAPASLWSSAPTSAIWNAALTLSPWTPNLPGSSWTHTRRSKSGRIKKPLTLACHTSEHGVAVVLTRNLEDGTECQVAVEMRTFLVSERSYSEIDKGIAAVLFGVRKCHKYLIGRAFTIVTDQEQLVRIFDPKRPIPNEFSPRYVKEAIALMSYHYDIVYKPVIDLPRFNESIYI